MFTRWQKAQAGDLAHRVVLNAYYWGLPVLAVFFVLVGVLFNPNVTAMPIWQGKGINQDDYLVGTIHVGDERLNELPKRLKQKVDAVDTLVVEVDLSKVSPLEQSQAVLQYAVLPADKTIKDVLSNDVQKDVNEFFRAYGTSLDQYQRFKPWMLAIVMVQMAYQELGLSPALGVDQQLINYAKTKGKQVVQLETFDMQLRLFNDLFEQNPNINYDDMLRDTLTELTQMSELPNNMLAAWFDGDLDAFEKMYQQTLTQTKFDNALEKALIIDRNQAWKTVLDPLLKEHSVLVATGTMHYIGPYGLPTILAAEFSFIGKGTQAHIKH